MQKSRWYSVFCFWPEIPFWGKFGLNKKVKIVNLGRNLVPRLIWICTIKWLCLHFQFSTRNGFLKQIWPKKLNCHLIWNLLPGFSLGTGVIPWLPKKVACSLHVSSLLWPKSVDFVIFIQFPLPFCPNSPQKLTLNWEPWVPELIPIY